MKEGGKKALALGQLNVEILETQSPRSVSCLSWIKEGGVCVRNGVVG